MLAGGWERWMRRLLDGRVCRNLIEKTALVPPFYFLEVYSLCIAEKWRGRPGTTSMDSLEIIHHLALVFILCYL
jgi:hypothetical protein